MTLKFNPHFLKEGHMDALFWIAQVVWLAFVIAGAYEAFTYRDLADAESARTATLDKRVPLATRPDPDGAEFKIGNGSSAWVAE